MLYSFVKQNNMKCLADVEETLIEAAPIIGGPIALLIANSTNYAGLVSSKIIDVTEVYAVSTNEQHDSIKAVLAYQADRSAYLVIYSINSRGVNDIKLVSAIYLTEISILLNLRELFKSTASLPNTRKDVAPYVKPGQVVLINSGSWKNSESAITSTLRTIVNYNLVVTACSKKYIVVNNIVLICIGTGRGHKDIQVESKSFIGSKIPELEDLLRKAPTGLLDLSMFMTSLKSNKQAMDYYKSHAGTLRPAHMALTTALSDINNVADIVVGLIKTPEADAICTHLSAAWFKRAVKQKLTRYPIEVTTDGKYDVQRLSTEATIKYPGQSWKGARQDDEIYVVTQHNRPDRIIGCIGCDAKDIKLIGNRCANIQKMITEEDQYCNLDIDIAILKNITLGTVKQLLHDSYNSYESASALAERMFTVFNYYMRNCLQCDRNTLREQYNIDIDKFAKYSVDSATTLENIVLTVEEILTFNMLQTYNATIRKRMHNNLCIIPLSAIAPSLTTNYKNNNVDIDSIAVAIKDICQNHDTNTYSFDIQGDNLSIGVTITPKRIIPHSFNTPTVSIKINGKEFSGIIAGDQGVVRDKYNHYYALDFNHLLDSRYFTQALYKNLRRPMRNFSDYLFPMDYLYDSMRSSTNSLKAGTLSVRQALYGKTFESFTSDSNSHEDAVAFTGLSYLCNITNMLPIFNYFGKYFFTCEEYKNAVAQEAEYDKCLAGCLTTVNIQKKTSADDIDLDDMDIEIDDIDSDYDEEDVDIDMDEAVEVEQDTDDIDMDDLEEDSDDAAWTFNRQTWLASHSDDVYIDTEHSRVYWFDILHIQMKADHDATGEALPYNDIQTLHSVWLNILKGMSNVSEQELLRMMYDSDSDDDGDAEEATETTSSTDATTVEQNAIATDDDDDLFAGL